MAFLNVANNAESTLASGINESATSLTVATGQGVLFPSSNFHITIDNEILKCTSRTEDTFTVQRGQEGTTPASHNAGAKVQLRLTAAIIKELQDELSQRTIVRAEATEGQTIPTSTHTLVNLPNEIFDTLGEFNPTTSKFTAQKSGYYLILGSIRWYGATVVPDKMYQISIIKNYGESNEAIIATTSTHSSVASSIMLQCLTIAYIQQGETLALFAYHYAGQDVTINYGNPYLTHLIINRIA